MYRIYLFCLLLSSHVMVGQLTTTYSVRQVVESGTSWGTNMQVYGNSMFLNNGTDEVRVYTRQETGEWTFLQSLKPSDKPAGAPNWRFGGSMAVNDSNAIITATDKDLVRYQAGGVYFYRKKSDGLWHEEFVFENPTGFNFYAGKNIALHNNKATVSHNNGYPRFVHIFERKHDGTWAIGDTITEPLFRGIDGTKVFFRDSVFIAMSYYGSNDQRVKEFRLQPNGTWTNTQILETGITSYGTYFGTRLVVQNDEMVVAAQYFNMPVGESETLSSAGKVYVYERVNNQWELKQELSSPTPLLYEEFGKDLVLKGDVLLITASGTKNGTGKGDGSIYLYKKNAQNLWTLVQTYRPKGALGIGRSVFYENGQIISYSYEGVTVLEEIEDCAGVIGGTAALNSCDICYGGTTGLSLEASENQCLVSSNVGLTPLTNIAVWPNPFSEELLISAPDNATISLVDCYGKVLKKNTVAGRFDTAALNAGMYFVTVEYEGVPYVFKLLKH